MAISEHDQRGSCKAELGINGRDPATPLKKYTLVIMPLSVECSCYPSQEFFTKNVLVCNKTAIDNFHFSVK